MDRALEAQEDRFRLILAEAMQNHAEKEDRFRGETLQKFVEKAETTHGAYMTALQQETKNRATSHDTLTNRISDLESYARKLSGRLWGIVWSALLSLITLVYALIKILLSRP